jgi:CheY-like chemotaxis protein
MNSTDPLIPVLRPSSDEEDTRIITRQEWPAKNNYPDLSGLGTRSQRAEERTEQAETRTEQANTRTEQANARTEQANARTEQSEARTEQANTRTEQAEMRSKQAEARIEGGMAKTAANNGKKRILAVDDRASNTRLVKLYLERTNHYVVREVNDPNAALAAAEEFQPHLILLDVMMPGLDGGDLAACFQASPTLQTVPIVFLTAAVTKGEVEAGGGQIGGNAFLAKPIVLKEMLVCLQHHLGG